MSPVPIVALQRGLSIIGQIRMGQKSEKGAPQRLTTWRLTSSREDLIREAAGLYGGEPRPWQSPVGPEWEVVTTAPELPVMLIPGYGLTQTYEKWEGPTKCSRRCDGEEELQSGAPCLCNAEGVDICDLYTRLTVALPELPTMLGWRLRTEGGNAARELAGGMQLVEAMAQGRPFVPGRIRITERRGNVNGQATRYVVPVIDVDVRYATAFAAVPAGRELPAGYKPVTALPTGTTVGDGLRAVEDRKPEPRNGRSAAPIPVQDDLDFDASPVPVPAEGSVGEPSKSVPADGVAEGPDAAAAAQPASPTDKSKPTAAQVKKLNTVVGQLRDGGKITTAQLWAAMAKERNVPVDEMVELLSGRDAEGVLHWHQLRDSLTRDEASGLLDRLDALQAKVAA